MRNLILTVFMVLFALTNMYSQNAKLKDYLDPKNIKDYQEKVKESELYKIDSRYIVHNFEVLINDQQVEKGKIYRKFFKKGAYESFHIAGDKNLVKVGYWNDPTALITANYLKKDYCVEKNINPVLFPMIIRGYAKIWKSGTLEKKFKNITFQLKKGKDFSDKHGKLSQFKVITNPKVMEGTISFNEDGLVAQGELTLYPDNIQRSGLKELFSFDALSKKASVVLKFQTEYIETNKPAKFIDVDLENIIKNLEKIECD